MPGPDGGGDAQDVGPVGADQGHVDATADQRRQRRMVGRFAEAAEASVLQVGNAPRNPRRPSLRKNAVQKVRASELPMSMPSTEVARFV